MYDQASNLRKLAGQKSVTGDMKALCGRIITIASGKGGVGKTNIAVNLAIALGKAGKKTMLLDADLGMANVDIILGMTPQYTLLDVMQGKKTLGEIIITGPAGIKIVSGGSGIFELANIRRLNRIKIITEIELLARSMDYLFIDSGAGISESVIGFATAADDVIMVITPEPTSITDGYGMIKVLSKFKLQKKVYLVINRADNFKEAEATARKIKTVIQRFLGIQVVLLGYVYYDQNVEKAVKKMEPFMSLCPHTQATKDVSLIADNLLRDEPEPILNKNSFCMKLRRLFK